MKPALLRNRTSLAVLIMSMGLAAIGQPDRGLVCSMSAYLFGYTGLFYGLRQSGATTRGKQWIATLWALGVFGFQLSWLATTHYHGPMILLVYGLAVLVFAIPFGWIVRRVGTFSWHHALSIPALWTVVEWSRPFFPFHSLGLVLTADPWTMQMASVVGIYGLTFFVLFTSYLGAFGKWYAFPIPLLVSIPHLLYWQGGEGPEIKIALIQPGLTVEEKYKSDPWPSIEALLPKEQVDLLILPEVAVVGDFATNFARAKAFPANEWIIGLIEGDYNSAFNQEQERYNKQVLVPCAEYLPLSLLGSFFSRYGIKGSFKAGEGGKRFEGKVPYAVTICYEEGFPHIVRAARRLGAKLLVNISNDGWFPHSRLAVEHANLGRVRAVENGVCVVRACNTGVTEMIDPFGNILGVIDSDKGCLQMKLTCYSYPTIYTKCGPWLMGFLCASCLLKRKSYSTLITLLQKG